MEKLVFVALACFYGDFLTLLRAPRCTKGFFRVALLPVHKVDKIIPIFHTEREAGEVESKSSESKKGAWHY